MPMAMICLIFFYLEEFIINNFIPYKIESFGIKYIIIGLIQYIVYLFLTIILVNVIYKIIKKKHWKGWLKIPNKLKILFCFLYSPIMFTFCSIIVYIIKCLFNNNITFLIQNSNLFFSVILLMLVALLSFFPYYFSLPMFMKIFLVEKMNNDEYDLFSILSDILVWRY
jgi:hypothetical protein